MILLALHLNSLVSLGVAIAAAFGVIALGWAYKRAGIVKVWQETAAGYKERADQLDRSLQVAEARIQALENEVAVLKAKTDLTLLEKIVTEHHTEEMTAVNATLALLDKHVKEETTVWVALMKVLPSMRETVEVISEAPAVPPP